MLSRETAKWSKSVERYWATLDCVPACCQIIGFDWTYLYANNSAARYSSVSKDELLGRLVTDFFPGMEDSGAFCSA